VPDLEAGRGALGGLYTSLHAARTPLVAVTACDMPFVSLPLFEAERDLILRTGADVVLPETVHGLEPLHAVYRRETCLPTIETALRAGEWKLIVWLPKVTVIKLTADTTLKADPSGLAFWNLNTPEDFRRAEERAGKLETN
jgi:molybdopterin-guanine dinucleotide biosynthesis protein A